MGPLCSVADETWSHAHPEPSDTYDGADTGSGRSWGVVDDTCDGIIEAQVVIDGVRKVARARIVTGPPDFAPDRRPFVSLADDLADRELALPDVDAPVTLAEIADLFRRVFETVSLVQPRCATQPRHKRKF